MDKTKVLLAEDHIVVREGTRELIQHQPDMEVVGEASDGEEAVELTAKLRPNVVIMDIAMPKLNGIEASLPSWRQEQLATCLRTCGEANLLMLFGQ